MSDYIDREALLEKIKKWYCSKCKTDDHCRACWVDDMIGEIEDAPEPSRKDKLRYALEVIHDECESQDNTCWDCSLFVAAEIGSCCELDRDIPKNWKPERMIHNYDTK